MSLLNFSYLLTLVASSAEGSNLVLLFFFLIIIIFDTVNVDQVSNALFISMTLQKAQCRWYLPIKLTSATMQTKAAPTKVGKTTKLCAKTFLQSLEI